MAREMYITFDLEAKPNLNSTVAADLPDEVCIDSKRRPASRLSSASFSTTTTTKCKGDKSEVIDLLRYMQADCNHKKTKDAHWREKEEFCLEKEEEHKTREEARKEEEYLCSQWECARLNIQRCCTEHGNK